MRTEFFLLKESTATKNGIVVQTVPQAFFFHPKIQVFFFLLPEGKLSHLHIEGSLVNEPSQELILPCLPP